MRLSETQLTLHPSDMRPSAHTRPLPLTQNDPRWALAIRTYQSLDGEMLSPEKREKLIRLGKTLNLTLFDTNLIIAIIQDRARRNQTPEDAISTLEMIRPVSHKRKYRRSWLIAGWCSLIIIIEFMVLYFWLK